MTDLHTFVTEPAPFTVAFPAEEVADLWRRLGTARWPAVDVVPEPRQGKEDGDAAFGLGWGTYVHLIGEGEARG